MGAIEGVKKLLSPIVKAAVKAGLLPNEIVVMMDGGICSQMHFYLIGEVMRRKGYPVAFDLEWFRHEGKDSLQKDVRNFELLRMFPYLPFTALTRVEEKLLKIPYTRYNDYFSESSDDISWTEITPPAVMTGYYHDFDEMYTKIFPEVFKVNPHILPESNMPLYEWILGKDKGEGCLGMHVRRGDLSEYHPAYGTPPAPQWFAEAAAEMVATYKANRIILFSDNPQWCREEVVSLLPKECEIHVADVNGPDCGYLDLALLSRCHLIVGSQGSMGKYAAMLRENPEAPLIIPDGPDSEAWCRRIPSAITTHSSL